MAFEARELWGPEGTPARLRSAIAMVPQETFLFSDTVRENIAYGQPDATDGQIIAAAKLANADEFIVKMSRGYESQIGERGITLSGGTLSGAGSISTSRRRSAAACRSFARCARGSPPIASMS